jgi:hypothetical protein
VTFTDFVVLRLVSESFRAQLVPYTGWLASMFYAFTIFFAGALVYQRQKRATMRFAGIALQLAFSIVFGILQMLQIGRETFGNPYLTISPWRAVWTIAIPCIWIAALYSPAMNRFCLEQERPLCRKIDGQNTSHGTKTPAAPYTLFPRKGQMEPKPARRRSIIFRSLS